MAERYARSGQKTRLDPARTKGTPIPTNDLWIAATALEHGYAVYTGDRHFAEIDNLRSGDRLSDFLP